MKNLNIHSTFSALVLSRKELRSINGGGFWRIRISRVTVWLLNQYLRLKKA